MSDARTRNTNIRRVGGALLAFVQQIETAYERSASSNKLHPTDFRAICLLRASRKPMSPKQLGAALGLAPGAVSALIYRLEVGGFVFREANPAEPHGLRTAVQN
ncbi:MarR family winged helix-turn-helix transcriptional regulator [Henriciella aquimarina]|uniref:MarR family winged helix-turn-helix transcriptional regulator n=1 Tax=Henriciella aquimarina TaxID=545261 RepID=UPI00117ABE27|nr:MarR family transcriptional regulator [Henriciella aquimarina]